MHIAYIIDAVEMSRVIVPMLNLSDVTSKFRINAGLMIVGIQTVV
jgi:hypothetical protein